MQGIDVLIQCPVKLEKVMGFVYIL